MKPKRPKSNPRFVWLIGAIAEQYSDLPQPDTWPPGTTLWDRQERKPVGVIYPDYHQAMCLELTKSAATMPFTNLEDWFNRIGNRALQSENITPTKKGYQP